MYYYAISYANTRPGGFLSLSTSYMSFEKPLDSILALTKMTEHIEKERGIKNVVILMIYPLTGENELIPDTSMKSED